ncbi:helix-turn-helix domain-containing protein, partial [Streptomyces sp. SID2131]|nr:helix-turn-helix domain-containing protein [Streptomyces sp. SID2131]
AGRGLPLAAPDGAPPGEALAGILGRNRAALLHALSDGPRTTTDLARRLGVSNATASSHTQALRTAGLLTTTRTGRSVHHERTPLGTLLTS